MSSVPRTKPWEMASGATATSVPGGAVADSSGISGAPMAPERPTSLSSSEFTNMTGTTPYGGGSYGGSSSYNSGYGSRYGSGMGSLMYGSGMGSLMYGSGMGSLMYGGGYGSLMYGGGYGSLMYGGGMGGYGSLMYGGMGGMGGMGMQPGMGQGGLGEGTQATFQLIESIIGAVGGFAQMLEATYMATHSSFFTMVSLAEQFGNLKNALGSLLGIFALIKFIKKIFHKVTGQTYNYGLNLSEFAKFEKSQLKLEENLKRQQGNLTGSRKPRISFKPLLLFLAASIGFPYLLSKAIQKLNQQNELKRQQAQLGGGPGPIPGTPGAINPANLQFAKALYEFNPENPNIEIELKPNELVAILSKMDPVGNESKWWKVRSRLGKVGYVPSNYLSVIERKAQVQKQVVGSENVGLNLPTAQNNEDVLKGKLSVNDFEKFQGEKVN
jgi:Variant SH3 domain./Peroxin 13, N-terminal region.